MDIVGITLRSIIVSGSATLLASTWSLPLAYIMARRPGLGRLLSPVLEALVGIPTVVVGLLVYGLLSRQGPLGFLDLLYTPQAIIVGESILVTPLLASVAYRVLQKATETYWELAYTLGASESRAMAFTLQQAAPGLVAAVVMAFSRAIGELGVALLVGGNIKGETRVLTTAIALLVSQGEYRDALVLGGILVAVTLSFSIASRALARWVE